MRASGATHGLVSGGGLAGLLSAQVLARHLDAVTIVERDRLPGEPVPRAGTPQARHSHAPPPFTPEELACAGLPARQR